ncbi:DUF3710 domain-containing protein [Populibacterium corticicola]|uniref:DUF3710 domain-containing protein n=1 Tax=Populibacterium corticicola TaxID=1812826 RepID=A0ABW5XBU3_9MICO
MALFRRNKNSVPAEPTVEQAPAPQPTKEAKATVSGPFDAADVPERGERLDLGAIWLPGREGAELRMEVDQRTQRVTGVAIALNGSILQLQAFAAPKTLGIWDEIREEIAKSIANQGGQVDEVPGKLGRELLVKLPVKMKDGNPGIQPARFVGFDGPRWFLRGVFSGRAAFDLEAAKDLEWIFRNVVVVRGSEPRPPRDLLTLTLPGQRPVPVPATPEADLNPLKRGPEITQIG